MQETLYLGLMSGTSVDGLDIVGATFPNGHQVEIIAHETVAFSHGLRRQLDNLSEKSSLFETLKLEREFSEFTADAVTQFIQTKVPPQWDVAAIGFHGHTAFHDPLSRITYQIGDGSWLAAKTGVKVVADIRRKDVAIGGHGAPLAPAFHMQFLNKTQDTFAVVNIGGIANVSIIDGEQQRLLWGYDTGPGNTLLDAWYEKHQSGPFDKDGMWAKSGTTDPELLNEMLSDPYFTLPPPKSTGKEKFNADWLNEYIAERAISPQDIQATLTELTATSIARELNNNQEIKHCFLCGGGAYNQYLVSLLEQHCHYAEVASTQILGIPPEWVEATAFAWFAKQRVENQKVTISSITECRAATSLGGIYLP